MSNYKVEYHVGDDPIGLEMYLSSHTPEREVFARKIAAAHERSVDEIHIYAWYSVSGRVEGESYGTRWGSLFRN